MRRIRNARPEDARAVTRVLVEAREAAYRGVLPDRAVDWMRTQMDAAGWEEMLRARRHGLHEIAVAEVDDRVVAYADWSRERNGAPNGDVGEVSSLFVLPRFWKNGIGSELLRFAETRLRGLGFGTAVLWVLRDNRRGRRFYERAGWSPDGAWHDLRLGGCSLRQLRYRKTLALPASSAG